MGDGLACGWRCEVLPPPPPSPAHSALQAFWRPLIPSHPKEGVLSDGCTMGNQKFALGGGGRMVGGAENGLPSPRANFVCFYPVLMGGGGGVYVGVPTDPPRRPLRPPADIVSPGWRRVFGKSARPTPPRPLNPIFSRHVQLTWFAGERGVSAIAQIHTAPHQRPWGMIATKTTQAISPKF